MKYKELEALLKANGCTIEREGGNHNVWYSPITKKLFPVGHHGSRKEVNVKTLHKILKQSGIK